MIECLIDGTLILGVVDTQCDATLIQEDVSKQLGLHIDHTECKRIKGYGSVFSGRTQGIVEASLTTNKYTTKAKFHVVANELQQEDIIIGRDITERSDLVAITNNGKWWFFENKDKRDGAPFLEPGNSMQTVLITQKKMTIPPKTTLSCHITTVEQGVHTVYIEKVEPFDTLDVDHLGPFVNLIVVVDAFTKYVFLGPAPNTKAVHVIKFLDRIINTYGVPRQLVCDQGSAFTSSAFTEYCETLNMKRSLTTRASATPRGNGQVERVNGVVLDRLISIIDQEERWDRYIEQIQFAIKTKVLDLCHMSYS